MTGIVATLTRHAEDNGTALTRFNALRHGILSRYTVLPWEDEEEYAVLVASLVEEHHPKGPTEEHLVEEIAGILWRKRRLRMAEAAAHHRGLYDAIHGYDSRTANAAVAHLTDDVDSDEAGLAVRTSADDNAAELADIDEDETMTRRAISILGSRRNDAYEPALAELRDDTCEWWQDVLDRDPEELKHGEEPATADVDCLRQFLEDEVVPWYRNKRSDIANRPRIRAQAYGEALDPFKLEKLGRYEVHLDRKLERMLAMLIKLQDLRRPTATG